MNCFNCYFFQLNEIIVDDYIYPDCQLPNIVLNKIRFLVCPYCAASYAVIDNRSDLHRSIALELINKKGKLTFKEIVFLLKLSGYHEIDIAPMMSCDVSTILAWESGNVEMSEIQEDYFRSLMSRKLNKKDRDFERNFPTGNTPAVMILFMNNNGEWQVKNNRANREKD
jgi:DNA-binding transcriptional regulator YiaG